MTSPLYHRRRALFAIIASKALGGCAMPGPAPGGAGLHIVQPSDWGALPSAPAAAPAQVVTQITVHHQGQFASAGADVPAYLRRLQQWSRVSRGWVDLPYHYIVDIEGKVYAGRSAALAGDSNTDYDTHGHLQVMLMGNFEQQLPTLPQWNSTVRLLAHLLHAHRLDATRMGAHRHHTLQTVCPGAQLMARFDTLRADVANQAARLGPR